jgi:SAM-dependent methyltransferase
MARKLHNILVNKIHDTEFAVFAKKYLQGKKVIDIGCGTKPFKEILAPIVSEHIGVDHELSLHDKSNVDITGTAYQIPVNDEEFDGAICTAVLEHLEEPEQALRECHRILKGGGIAIYSIPFIWHLHEEPRDFYRFSKFGIQHLFNKTGFEIIELKELSGFIVTFSQMLVYYLNRFNRGPLKWLRIIDALNLIIQGKAYLLNKFDKSHKWTWMYMVVARKKK